MAEQSDTYIGTAFEDILSSYLLARFESFGREHRLWRVFENLAKFLENHVKKRRSRLIVKASPGKGNWARVPWIAFLDERETRSTTYGIYPVYLFREDMSGVYITFNQGVTRLKDRHGVPESRRILRERAKAIRELSSVQSLKEFGFSVDTKIDLHTSRGLGKSYEDSTICYKPYLKGAIPNDNEILNDLEQVLRAYDQYLERQPFREAEEALSVSEDGNLEEPIDTLMPAAPQSDFEISKAIHEVIAYIENRGFIYEPWQIAQYITAIRTKPFVILAGITGTGKSKLPKLVAEATGGESKLVPVRPDWTDSADVLGYKDLEGNFQPGPVLELASDASANPDQFYTCIVDEMNLARVEQYFAEVLSRLEDRQPDKKGETRSGYSTGPLIGQVRKADAEWGEVVIPANLAIVGTVNMDESTHGFSRKVLDRAFTIELSEVHLAHWNPNGAWTPNFSTWPVTSWHPINIRLSELENPSTEQLTEINRAINALAAVNNLLAPSQLQVGYRTRDEVAFYLLHAQQISDAFVDRDGNAVDPLDLALQMKILPRIAGSSNAIKKCVYGLLGWATNGVPLEAEDEVNSIVEPWKNSGQPSAIADAHYPRLAARLCWMWQRLDADGYTSYWL
jgi:MrcB-like, N-terminal domain/AAA domain (dynein-related subfamily)